MSTKDHKESKHSDKKDKEKSEAPKKKSSSHKHGSNSATQNNSIVTVDGKELIRIEYKTPFAFEGAERIEKNYIYRLSTKSDCYQFRCFADSLDGFHLRHEKLNDVMVWDQALPGEPMHVIKVFGLFVKTPEDPTGGCTPKEMWDLLQDAVFREQWDNFRAEAFEIVKLDPTNDIGYYAAKSPLAIVANRDFVNQRMWHDTGRGEYVIFNTSVLHDDVPPSYMKDNKKNKNGSYVRAFSKLTGYLVQPYTDPKTGEVTGTALTYITQSDPCGWIPATITNYIATKFAPNTINNVREALKKFRTWLPEQVEKGTYEKGWDLEHPADWDEGEKVKNATMEFAKARWLEEMEKEEKKKSKKKDKDHK